MKNNYADLKINTSPSIYIKGFYVDSRKISANKAATAKIAAVTAKNVNKPFTSSKQRRGQGQAAAAWA